MGQLGSKGPTTQILIIGPIGSGKTSLLYNRKLNEDIKETNFFNNTEGFQYEEDTV